MHADSGCRPLIVVHAASRAVVQRASRVLRGNGWRIASYLSTDHLLHALMTGRIRPDLWVFGFHLPSGVQAPEFCDYVAGCFGDVPAVILCDTLTGYQSTECLRNHQHPVGTACRPEELTSLVASLLAR